MSTSKAGDRMVINKQKGHQGKSIQKPEKQLQAVHQQTAP